MERDRRITQEARAGAGVRSGPDCSRKRFLHDKRDLRRRKGLTVVECEKPQIRSALIPFHRRRVQEGFIAVNLGGEESALRLTSAGWTSSSWKRSPGLEGGSFGGSSPQPAGSAETGARSDRPGRSGVLDDRPSRSEPCWRTAPERRRWALPTSLKPRTTISSESRSVKHKNGRFPEHSTTSRSPRRSAAIPRRVRR